MACEKNTFLPCQFQQFQALTQARLDMLAVIQNLNSSRVLESHVHAPTDHWYHVSKDFEHLKQRTRQEIQGLRLELHAHISGWLILKTIQMLLR